MKFLWHLLPTKDIHLKKKTRTKTLTSNQDYFHLWRNKTITTKKHIHTLDSISVCFDYNMLQFGPVYQFHIRPGCSVGCKSTYAFNAYFNSEIGLLLFLFAIT